MTSINSNHPPINLKMEQEEDFMINEFLQPNGETMPDTIEAMITGAQELNPTKISSQKYQADLIKYCRQLKTLKYPEGEKENSPEK